MFTWHSFLVIFNLLLLMAELAIIIFPLFFFGIYLAAKIALWIKPGCGCRPDPNGPSDAEDIVSQCEQFMKGFIAGLKETPRMYFSPLINIFKFIKNLFTKSK